VYDDYSRGSVRKRALRIARQRGLISEGGSGMVLGIVLLVVAALAALWMVAAVGSFVFSLIPLALVGLLTGWVASRLTGARLSTGWTILAGIAGSFLGPALLSLLPGIGLAHVSGLFNPLHLIASVLGATILIVFARAINRPALTGSPRPRLYP
jgi:uncharacterized membrane protein YeaQ/YmgE (transglycosylase-associated protein family)